MQWILKNLVIVSILVGNVVALESGFFIAGNLGMDMSFSKQESSFYPSGLWITSPQNGMNVSQSHQPPTGLQVKTDSKIASSFGGGIKLGYIHHAPKVKRGVRAYASYHTGSFIYGNSPYKGEQSNGFDMLTLRYHEFGVGADYLIDLSANSFGVALGLEVAYVNGDLAKFLEQKLGSNKGGIIPYANIAIYKPFDKLLFELGARVGISALLHSKQKADTDKFYLTQTDYYESPEIIRTTTARMLSFYAQVSYIF
ncbi:hypothetical protein [uncultured Helicobacter sp.]|uniref:hypothetical protein n=1 Tax=uncultured Helicobacter sp. TaxID=175537 RepID=UPI00375134E3